MSAPERLLLHVCCAPCLIAPVKHLHSTGIAVTAYWFNPNIHPWTEYRNRLETLKDFCSREQLPLIVDDDYGLRDFVAAVVGDVPNRCAHCYTSRLEATAKKAAELNFEAFSTTLLYSKYQKHDLIVKIAENMAKRYRVRFYYQDWRPFWEEGILLSKSDGMYRQKYCGCIFSEEERYRKQD
jgi:epoxyqueuosine reductase